MGGTSLPRSSSDPDIQQILSTIDRLEGQIHDIAATQARPEIVAFQQRKPLMVWVTLLVILLWNWPIFANLWFLLQT